MESISVWGVFEQPSLVLHCSNEIVICHIHIGYGPVTEELLKAALRIQYVVALTKSFVCKPAVYCWPCIIYDVYETQGIDFIGILHWLDMHLPAKCLTNHCSYLSHRIHFKVHLGT